ncbi:MAG: CbtA family protein [Acidimicrobiales bacterium]
MDGRPGSVAAARPSTKSLGRTLSRGLVAGAVGGLAMAGVLLAAGEGPLSEAIALEVAADSTPADLPFTRSEQVAGGAVAAVAYGATLGLIFALVFSRLRPGHRLTHGAGASGDQSVPTGGANAGGAGGVGAGRVRRVDASAWTRSMALAGAGFLGVYLVPFLRYPANPPTVGDPATIGLRTTVYLVAVVWGVTATWATWRLGRHLSRRSWPWDRAVPSCAVVWAALVVTGLSLLPVSPDPVGAPAELIWSFRIASLGGALALWSVMGTVFGWLNPD